MAINTIFIAALFASAIAAASALSAVPFSGATSTATYQGDVIAAYTTPADVGNYSSIGSPAGLANYCNGSYAIASSDYPDGAPAGTTICSAYPEVTLPQVLGSDSFGVFGAPSTLNLTAAQIWGIYNGSIRTWSAIPGASPLTGNITPIARADASGTTFLVTSWLFSSKTSIPASQVSDNQWMTGYTGVKYYTGTSGVITACKVTGAICYATTGSIAGVIPEASIQNYNTKAFSKGATAVLSKSVPATLPACTNTTAWSTVTLTNTNVTGAYALVTFEYLVARKNNTKSPAFVSTKVKAFLNFTQGSTAQGAAINRGFQPLPAAVVSQNVACIASIA